MMENVRDYYYLHGADIATIEIEAGAFIRAHLDGWTEKNAYGESNEIWPYCAYTTTNKPCSNQG